MNDPRLPRPLSDRLARALARAGQVLILALALAVPGSSARAADTQLASLADLTLEELSRVEVTSVSRRTERLADAAASIFVITSEDIRRSGATTLSEALRLAPNLDVARADANQYAITARGFASVLANKLLVMIDGRTIYSPLFSGVLWEAHDFLLQDIERIEVVSGPGGTLWGTNAVNGVINIVTRSAEATQGLHFRGVAGEELRSGAARYGGRFGSGVAYRVYGKVRRIESSERPNGTLVGDASERYAGGFRADWARGVTQFTVQGDVYHGEIDQGTTTRLIRGQALQGHWVHPFHDHSILQVRGYTDRTTRDQPGAVRDELHTFELEIQHGFRPLASHDLLWGAGYRYQPDRVVNINPAAFAFLPPNRRLAFASFFAQDDIAVTDRLTLIAGLRVEHNQYTEFEYLPNVRLAWKPTDARLLWGSVARTVRAPSRVDREFYSPGTPPFFVAGGPDFRSEVVKVAELGYRAQPSAMASYSISGYYAEWDRLRSLELSPAGPVFANGVEGIARGLETWASLRIVRPWRLSAGWTTQSIALHARPGSSVLGGTATLGNDPPHWWLVRSSLDIGSRHELDVTFRRVGERPSPRVPAYSALDARIGWTPVRSLGIAVFGRNLLDDEGDGHAEWGVSPGRPEFSREVFAEITWRH